VNPAHRVRATCPGGGGARATSAPSPAGAAVGGGPGPGWVGHPAHRVLACRQFLRARLAGGARS